VTESMAPNYGTQPQPWEPDVEANNSHVEEHQFKRGPETEAQREPQLEPTPSNLRPSGRTTKGQHGPRYGYDASKSSGYFCTATERMSACSSSHESDHRYLMALLMDSDFGTQENMHPYVGECPMALKASKMVDPDSPRFAEAMAGPYLENFEEAMRKEIDEVQDHGTWEI
jgi:hypothetical protein